MRKSQISIEFILLLIMATFLLFIVMAAVLSISSGKAEERAYYEADDLGRMIQQEVILATDMEDGYIRALQIPQTISGQAFTINVNKTATNWTYMTIVTEKSEIYYSLPEVNGTLKKGINHIRKQDGSISIY